MAAELRKKSKFRENFVKFGEFSVDLSNFQFVLLKNALRVSSPPVSRHQVFPCGIEFLGLLLFVIQFIVLQLKKMASPHVESHHKGKEPAREFDDDHLPYYEGEKGWISREVRPPTILMATIQLCT